MTNIPIKPPRLAKNSTVGIIALSSPCKAERFEKGLKFLESLGFKVKVVLDPCKFYGRYDHLFSSDSSKARARALEQLFMDPEVKAVFSARGAYGSVEVLPQIDFGVLQKYPKPLVGYSDTTACLAAYYRMANVVTFHGASVEGAFAKASENEAAKRSAVSLIELLGGQLTNPFKDTQLNLISGKGIGEGRLVGGNLSVFTSLIGTPWELDLSDHILVLEDVGEKPHRVHRMLLQMKLAGQFKKLRGVVLGSFKNCSYEPGPGPSIVEVFADIFSEYSFPVVAGLPIGHEELNLPLPFGINARIAAGKLEFLESAVLE